MTPELDAPVSVPWRQPSASMWPPKDRRTSQKPTFHKTYFERDCGSFDDKVVDGHFDLFCKKRERVHFKKGIEVNES